MVTNSAPMCRLRAAPDRYDALRARPNLAYAQEQVTSTMTERCEQSKTVDQSRVTLNQLMLPEHTNAYGNVHGGLIMKMADEAGAIAAMRHAQRPCVTVAIDSMTFHSAVHVGELLSCDARVTYVGRSSIEVAVDVHAEHAVSREVTHTNSAYFVYVALADDGRPSCVPPLQLQSEIERDQFAAGRERQQRRLASRGR